MCRRLWCIVAFAATMLAASFATAKDDPGLAKALKYLEGIEAPAVGTLSTYNCEGKWFSDRYCKAINDVYKLKDDRYVGTVKRSVKAFRLKPSGRRAAALIGGALVDLGSCEHALPWLEAAAHIEDASHALGTLIHCSAFRRVGGDSERVLRLAELYANYTNSVWAWWAAARLHYYAGRYEIARDRADRIVHSEPDNYRGWRFYAKMLELFEDYPGAIRAYQESIRLRRKVKKDRALTADAVELLHRELADAMAENGQYQAADDVLASLRATPEEKERADAASSRVRLRLRWKGWEAARALAAETNMQDAQTEREVAFAEAKATQNNEYEPPSELGIWDKIAWQLHWNNAEGAYTLLSAAVRDGTLPDNRFGVLDFRVGKCGSLGAANSHYVGARADYADVWKDAMISARWTANCGSTPATGYNLTNAPPVREAFARSLHKAAVEFEMGNYANLAQTLAELPETGPPVYHVFRMWAAAATQDVAAFEFHEERARAGSHREAYALAHLFRTLRRGDIGAAREVWESLPDRFRQPRLVYRLGLVLERHIVLAAAEVDADFATLMAEAWFGSDGVIERGVWRRLRYVPTGFAAR